MFMVALQTKEYLLIAVCIICKGTEYNIIYIFDGNRCGLETLYTNNWFDYKVGAEKKSLN